MLGGNSMDDKKRYLFVKKVSVKRIYGCGNVTIRRHYEKELTEDELDEEIKDIQGERPISYAYMEISGTITYQGFTTAGVVPVNGGKMWYVWDYDDVSHYFNTKKECGDFIKANFKGEYRKACLMLLAHDAGRATVKIFNLKH